MEKALESLVQDSPDMLIVYFSILDVLAHRYGPDSNEVIDAMKLLDQQIQRLVEGILEHEPEAKLIILSDHGMVYVPPDHNIMIADILPSFNDRVAWVNEGTVLLIWPKDKSMYASDYFLIVIDDEKKLYDDLVEAFSKKGQNHARVWLKEEVPERLHFKNHHRIAPIIVDSDIGWNVGETTKSSPTWRPWL